MKHKPIFRLLILTALLTGCGKDMTEQPGPGNPAAGGGAISYRLTSGNYYTPDPEN
ncbi:MAG: hypothetical protein LUC96_00850 [Alistipes sp.]|uniref:hypothetical protein n=1 Tax=Alistipes sp. TaxID=1872444 RepID=UPI0025BB4CCA|nr:hypothetical protein [Alistipes sp.]MCD8273527.1 hypothetical protein [Alistipes sp.]